MFNKVGVTGTHGGHHLDGSLREVLEQLSRSYGSLPHERGVSDLTFAT